MRSNRNDDNYNQEIEVKPQYERQQKPQFKQSHILLSTAIAAAFALAPFSSASADDLSDMKAQILQQNQKIQELQKMLETVLNNKPAMMPAAASAPASAAGVASAIAAPLAQVPQSLRYDQDGTAIIDQYPEGLTIFDNSKTRLKIYGLVEPSLSHVTSQVVSNIPYGAGASKSIAAGGTPAGSYATTFGFQTSWFSGNRLGFDIEHDMGSLWGMTNLKAISKLETEFELPSGSFDTSNTLFNRDAWMGFYSPELGKLTFGRQNTLTRDFTQTWGDPYGTAEVNLREGGYTNVNNFKQIIFYSGSGDSTRMDSAIVWKKKYGDNWLVGLAHSFGFQGAGGSGGLGPGELYGSVTPGYTGGGQGGAVPGDPKNGATSEASVAYNGLSLGGKAVANINYSYNTVNVDDLTQTANLIGGNIVFNDRFRLNGGYIRYVAQQGVNNSAGDRTDEAKTLSGSMKFGQTSYSLGWADTAINHAGFIAGGSGGINMLPFISTAPNLSMLNAIPTNLASGHKKSVYGSAVYHWDKQTDFYLAADYVKIDGGISMPDAANNGTNLSGNPAHGINNETEIATGVRLKF